MASIKGTKTEQNLLKSFAGESQARNRYTYFAGVAKKEGFEQICAIFNETADNEKEHAKVFFKYLEGGDTEITAAYPAGARRLNDLIPQAEYAEFEDSWHNLFWDPESPRVLARMAEWLGRIGGIESPG